MDSGFSTAPCAAGSQGFHARFARLAGRACGLVLLAWFCAACGAPVETGRGESNEIQVVVDGVVAVTWTVDELLAGRVDWLSPDGTFFPAVPLRFAIEVPPVAVDSAALRVVRVRGQHETLELAGGDLPLLDGLILKLDLERGGTWQLVGHEEEDERRLVVISGTDRVKKVRKIEVELEGRSR